MNARLVTKMQIAAPPENVFRYLSQLRYHKFWNPHLQGSLPDITLSQGASYYTTSLLFGRKTHFKNIVSKCTENSELELCNDTGLLQYCVRYTLLPKAHGTLLTCNMAVSSTSNSFAFAKPILKLLVQRELQIDLTLLKTAVETHKE